MQSINLFYFYLHYHPQLSQCIKGTVIIIIIIKLRLYYDAICILILSQSTTGAHILN